ncbi:MAG: LysM peptidoglycan-binding domain-containing protein [Pseudomonadota bacterium]
MVVTAGTGFGIAAKAGATAMFIAPVVSDMMNSDATLQAPEPAPVVAPAVPETEDVVPVVEMPEITLVRVDAEGTAVIGGTAMPQISLQALFAGAPLVMTQATDQGDFVMIVDLPPSEEPQELLVIAFDENGVEAGRSQPVLVLGRQPDEAPLLVVDQGDDGVEIVKSAPEVVDDITGPVELSLETIEYTDQGDVTVGGRGALAGSVRVYLDNIPILTAPVAPSGDWVLDLPNVDNGIYTLRVDELNAEGEVTARVESPFKKEDPDLAAGSVTVQPGNTLWALAENSLGAGDRYVLILEANKDLIRDPNLIYPGQIFSLPE